ncbi:MAG: ABC transporter ATP-binding protein [Patescibacteria group bacterium]
MNKHLTKETIRIFWDHSKKYPWIFFIMVLTMICAVSADLFRPFLYKMLFNEIALNQPGMTTRLFTILVYMLLAALTSWVFWRSATFLNQFFELRVIKDLTNTCFKYLQEHSYNFFNNNFAGSLVRKVNKFSRSFETIVDIAYWNISQTLLRIIIIVVILSTRQWVVGAVVLVWAFAYIGFQFFFSEYKLKYDVERSKIDSQLTGQLADTITNNINIKLFGTLNFEIKAFNALQQKWYKIQHFSWTLAGVAEMIQSLFMVLLEFGVFYFAIKYRESAHLTVGDFVLIQIYIIGLFDHLWNFGKNIRKYYEAMSDAQEMTDILLTPHEVADIKGAKDLTVTEGTISFKNVEFGYQKTGSILKKFNLDIRAGEKVALIGPSGGGKSTITRIIFRFFDLQKGKVYIDNQDISKVTQTSLREGISLVPQEPILFHRSLMENIRYGKLNATDDEVKVAAKLAHCDEFINKFPDQYNTYVGERGVKLSGGERQRIAIARAILKNAPILVLDEATSSLDSESEKLIQDAMINLMHGKTTIVIAHRLSTIMNMDRIIVIENGEITEEGKHKELLKANKGTYQKLWQIQAGGFNKA